MSLAPSGLRTTLLRYASCECRAGQSRHRNDRVQDGVEAVEGVEPVEVGHNPAEDRDRAPENAVEQREDPVLRLELLTTIATAQKPISTCSAFWPVERDALGDQLDRQRVADRDRNRAPTTQV